MNAINGIIQIKIQCQVIISKDDIIEWGRTIMVGYNNYSCDIKRRDYIYAGIKI
jgi:hypothetical protein